MERWWGNGYKVRIQARCFPSHCLVTALNRQTILKIKAAVAYIWLLINAGVLVSAFFIDHLNIA